MKKNTILITLVVFIFVLSTAALTFAQKNVVAVQKGPDKAHQGENITIKYTVTNNGDQPIYNTSAMDQNLYKYLGTIQPGETKSFEERMYIPTDKEVKGDFGPDAVISNPFWIGGFVVSYQDANGKFTVNSNSLSIPLVSNSKPVNGNKTNGTQNSKTQSSLQGILQDILDFIDSVINYIISIF